LWTQAWWTDQYNITLSIKSKTKQTINKHWLLVGRNKNWRGGGTSYHLQTGLESLLLQTVCYLTRNKYFSTLKPVLNAWFSCEFEMEAVGTSAILPARLPVPGDSNTKCGCKRLQAKTTYMCTFTFLRLSILGYMCQICNSELAKPEMHLRQRLCGGFLLSMRVTCLSNWWTLVFTIKLRSMVLG